MRSGIGKVDEEILTALPPIKALLSPIFKLLCENGGHSQSLYKQADGFRKTPVQAGTWPMLVPPVHSRDAL